jgi:hypothetical protein
MKQDFENLSTDDLKDMRDKIDEIVEKRDKEKKDEVWNNLVRAMIEYVEISGEIRLGSGSQEILLENAAEVETACECTGYIDF